MGPFGCHAFGGAVLLHRPLSSNADKLVEAARSKRDLAFVEMRDGLDRAVQQVAVV